MEGTATAARFQQYPAYKDSGVDWLGEIPAHWEMKKTTHLFNRIGSGTTPTSGDSRYYDGDYHFLQTGDLNDGKVYYTNRTIKDKAFKDFSSLKLYSSGSLVMAMYGATIGKLGVLQVDAATNQACCVFCNPVTVSVEYFFFVLLSFRDKIVSLGYGGGQPNISQDLIKSLRFPIAPLPEQTAIAEFLDEKTGKIDRAIAQKEKLIGLLKERKQIIIQEAVTKGLDPQAKMKDSGVEWIGEIPVGWEVKRLKFLCHITTGSKNTEDKEENGQYPFFVRSQTPERINSYSFDGEAILTAGDGAGVGKVFHYINDKFDFHQRVYKFSKFDSVKGQFLFYYLQSNFYNVALNGEAKSTVDSLRLPVIQNFLVSLPLINEQELIVAHIEAQSGKIDKAIKLQEQQIEKLKELKATLIDSAVTGKIKVG